MSFEFGGERLSTEVRADATPFGLERRHNGEHTYLFFPGIEVDCASEPITTSDTQRSSIYKKIVAYRVNLSFAFRFSELLCPLRVHRWSPACLHDEAPGANHRR